MFLKNVLKNNCYLNSEPYRMALSYFFTVLCIFVCFLVTIINLEALKKVFFKVLSYLMPNEFKRCNHL